MKRREFVTAITAGGAMLLGSAAAAAGAVESPAQEGPLEYYELRRYHLLRGPHQQLVNTYWREAAIPALKRAGAGPIGVFNVMIGPESPSLYVLIVHKNVETLVTLGDRLAADAAYQQAAAAYLNVPATDPAFVRLESSLLRSFQGHPTVALPFGGGDAGKRSRIFELRTYESHSEKAALKKIEMFNTGEIAIFRRAGMEPVFLGQGLVGPKLPHLTYMLVYENMAAHDKAWSAFGSDPEWRKLSTTPGYTDPDIVANITNLFLRPTDYSEV